MKRAVYLLPGLALAATMACSSSGTGTGTVTRLGESTQAPPFDTNQPAANADQPTANADQPTANPDQPPPNPDQPTPASGQGSESPGVTCTRTCVNLSGRCGNSCNQICVRCIASPADCSNAIQELFRECFGQQQTPNDFGTGGATGIAGAPGIGGIGNPAIDAGGP